MPYILLGEPAYLKYRNALSSFGFTPIALVSEPRLNATVSTHADTLIYTDGKTHIANEDYLKRLPTEIRKKINAAGDFPFGNYPTDTAFNALCIGTYVFAHTASLAPSVVSAANASGHKIINVNQGYAKCAVLALCGENAAITADNGMAKAMEEYGVRVLKISPGGIALEGCEYGFIGGASFVYEPSRTVFFFGDISAHPDKTAILSFIESLGYKAVSLEGELTDFGGAVIV